jgi:hypothetical protein
MITKQEMAKAIAELPDDATLDDAIDKLLLLTKIERARAQVAAGETLTKAEARARLSKWLK